MLLFSFICLCLSQLTPDEENGIRSYMSRDPTWDTNIYLPYTACNGTWSSVTCTGGHITGLKITQQMRDLSPFIGLLTWVNRIENQAGESQYLTGTLPIEFTNLVELTYFVAIRSYFHGKMPNLSNLTKLRTFFHISDPNYQSFDCDGWGPFPAVPNGQQFAYVAVFSFFLFFLFLFIFSFIFFFFLSLFVIDRGLFSNVAIFFLLFIILYFFLFFYFFFRL